MSLNKGTSLTTKNVTLFKIRLVTEMLLLMTHVAHVQDRMQILKRTYKQQQQQHCVEISSTAAERFCNSYQLCCATISPNVLVQTVMLLINKVLKLCASECFFDIFLWLKKAIKDNLAWHLKQTNKKKKKTNTKDLCFLKTQYSTLTFHHWKSESFSYCEISVSSRVQGLLGEQKVGYTAGTEMLHTFQT